MSSVGTYIIRHASGMFYIGSTQNITVRKTRHLSDLARNQHPNPKLQQAYLTDPNVVFEFYPTTDREEAYALEDDWIKNSWGDPLLTNTVPYSRVSAGIMPQWLRDKIGNAGLGRLVKEETRNKISVANTGKTRRDDTKALMSSQRQGVPKSPEWSEKIADAKRVKVEIDGVVYPSATAAALVHKCSLKTVLNRTRNEKFPNWKIL